jgi:hypothetical protein
MLAIAVQLVIHLTAGTEAWIADEVAIASARLAHEFTWTAGAADEVPGEILTVDQRDALAALDDGDAVHVFVVERIADKDDDGWIGGVTWRAGKRRFVILSHTDARVDTLAHELGHFFGLHHQTADDNLMTGGRDPGSGLTKRQLRTVRKKLRAWERAH